MIYYFSGTGNSRWAAEKLAEYTGDVCCSISEAKGIPESADDRQTGLVFPIYAWGVPEPMLDFVKRLERKAGFTYGVCTCGADAGKAMKKLSRIAGLDSSYSLVMPNNYIIGSDVDDEKTARSKFAAAERELKSISEEVRERIRTYRVHEGSFAVLKSSLINPGFNRFARTTKPFYVTDACCGCGWCAERCPAETIRITDGKPVWGKKCFQCLRCIHECPQEAIQYGKETEGRKRYRIEEYLQKRG